MSVAHEVIDGKQVYFPAEQSFECRDCAARCCTMPWRVAITPEERDRFEAQEWVRERLERQGAAFYEAPNGQLSMPLVVRESDQRLVCAFLDEDGLCSQLKHHDRMFWSRTCRTYPYEFIEDENGNIQTALSQHCPSIRENYGEPMAPQLAGYFADSDGTKKLAGELTVGTGTRLAQPQWLEVVQGWEATLDPGQGAPDLATALWHLFRQTVELGNGLVGQASAGDGAFGEALRQAERNAGQGGPPALADGSKPSLLGGLFVALSLARLTLPLRLIDRPRFSFSNAWCSFRNTMRLWKRQGEIDLLQMSGPLELAKVKDTPPVFADAALERRAREYYVQVLARRNLFCEEGRSLHDIVLDLGVAYAVMQFVARCRAVAAGRGQADMGDLGEGIAYAECFFLFHYSRAPKPAFYETLQATLSTNEPAFRGILNLESK